MVQNIVIVNIISYLIGTYQVSENSMLRNVSILYYILFHA